MTQRLLAIANAALAGREAVDAIVGPHRREELEIRLVVPTPAPTGQEAGRSGPPPRERLEVSLAELRRRGIAAFGTIAGVDPLRAAEDALRQAPADEVVILERVPAQQRWLEDGLFERAGRALAAPLRLVILSAGECGGAHIIAT